MTISTPTNDAMPAFALNHMVAPRRPLADFFALAKSLHIDAVEIRNDLEGNAIADGTPAAAVRQAAEAAGIHILSINALQKFNRWDEARAAEAVALADYAAASGAAALVLVPTNDGEGRGNGERQANLRVALKELRPILEDRGLTGLVEPLGFRTCSLRSKREAADAIASLGMERTFRLVHDTFHHHLAGEPELFPGLTGLVHISGVEDPGLGVDDMRDAHRVLVGAADRLDNAGQMRALLASGYDGCFSFEPFASSVHGVPDPAAAVRGSMAHLREALASEAA
jgi:2-keto-myo-inositol isomerase